MFNRFSFALLFGLSGLLVWQGTIALPVNAQVEQMFHLSGRVTLVRPGPGAPLKDASKVVVWLSPEEAIKPADVRTSSKQYRMVQRNKSFQPALMVVPLGSLIEFPNLDPWFHNVFSLYQGKRFDLGLYEAGTEKKIRFDKPGASYIFCNIHPEMAAVVLTVDSDWYAISDKAGRIAIDNVPRGKYLLHVWYENADERSLDLLARRVEVNRDDDMLLSVSVPVHRNSTEHERPEHNNKYG